VGEIVGGSNDGLTVGDEGVVLVMKWVKWDTDNYKQPKKNQKNNQWN
jgi:hypothetical protein